MALPPDHRCWYSASFRRIRLALTDALDRSFRQVPVHAGFKRVAFSVTAVLLVLTLACGIGQADDSSLTTNAAPPDAAEQLRFFETKIRPVLVEHCYECHSVASSDLGGKLLLDSREGMRVGGESGPLVPVTQIDASLLIAALRHEGPEMPPDERLSDVVIDDFVRWLESGAFDPRESKPEEVAAALDAAASANDGLWSLRPLSDPPIPSRISFATGVSDEQSAEQSAGESSAEELVGWPREPIDHFVLQRLVAEGLSPTEAAPPELLVRRLFFDLTGLPPEPQQVTEYVAAYAEDPEQATASLVDRLLASPRFGERWGRHWLDVARFGESNGNDGLSRNATFPHAWRYRDYVIDAFNEDLRYDRFLTEQIAGDLLAADSPAQRDRQLIATGFLAIGSKPAKAMNVDFEMDVVADQIDVVSTAVMGLSVACARCHDHKHDPISTRDYYALAGIFLSTETLWGNAANEKLTAPPTPLHTLTSLAPRPDMDLATADPGVADAVAAGDAKDKKKPAKGDKAAKAPVALAMGVRERDAAKITHCKVNLKGQSNKLGDEVPRGFLESVRGEGAPPTIPDDQSGRLQLAEWLTRGDHPLTSRVLVNRVWLHLLGQPLVPSPDDFGHYGDRPTHPELLDHLAGTFQRDGWSVKRLIRRIVLSRTYQLSSTASPEQLAADPDNRWLGRHPRKRLDAESLRDRMLAVSGLLDLRRAGGSAIEQLDVLVNKEGNLHRPSFGRSVYLCMLRNSPPPELAPFDFPDGIRPIGMRHRTTLPAQSLYLLNSPFVVDVANRFAERIWADAEGSFEAAVSTAFDQAIGRPPSELETEQATKLLAQWPNEQLSADEAEAESGPEADTDTDEVDPLGDSPPELAALAAVCQALLAANEFRYLD
ncbi:MAG: DUF1553 domain-containing protein [Planctomycetaceae bacterium]|nr:MAG: DUF1553 domain-containing protein [Planctomycetaceae bacterium]